MAFYRGIDAQTPSGSRTVERLLALRDRLSEKLATWNLREFGGEAYGPKKKKGRTNDVMHYMVEIIPRFDTVALQEVNKALRDPKRQMRLLGWNCRSVVTDMTAGTPGNQERLTLVFERRKVTFGGLAGEVVLLFKRVKRARASMPTSPRCSSGVCRVSAAFEQGGRAFHYTPPTSPGARGRKRQRLGSPRSRRSRDFSAHCRRMKTPGPAT